MAQNGTTQVTFDNGNTLGSITAFCRLVFVLLLRAGYLLIQLSYAPAENVNNIVLQNIIDISIGIISFALFGYIIAYGSDVGYGIIGWNTFIDSPRIIYDELIFGICNVLIGTAIITTITSGRIHFIGYLMTNIFYSGVLLPVYMHWIWNIDGFLRNNYFSKYLVSAQDYAGATVLHMSAGITGLVASLFLGRRILVLHDTDKSSIGAESFKMSIIGYIFVVIGMIAFSLPTPHYRIRYKNSTYYGIILVNNILAISGSIITIRFLSHVFFRKDSYYVMIQRCIKGSILGIVSISAGIDIFYPLIALAVAIGGAVLFTLVSYLLQSTFREDNCNIVYIHIVCALYSCTIVAFTARTENLDYSVGSVSMLIRLFWQVLTAACVLITTLVFMYILHRLLVVCGFLQNKREILNYTLAKTKPNEKDQSGMNSPSQIDKITSQLEQRCRGISAEESNINKIDCESVPAGIESNVESETGKDHFRSFETNLKSTIFTIQNARPILESDTKYSCGDFAGTELKNTIKIDTIRQPQGKPEESFHSDSGIRLHRTKKQTNLCKTCINEKNELQDHFLEICFPPSEEDKKYNDGFVTIKKPPSNL